MKKGITASKKYVDIHIKLLKEFPQFPLWKYLAEKGTEFENPDLLTSRTMRDKYSAMPKECYKNNQLIVIHRKDLDYWEGFATHSTIPISIEHSWLTRKGSKKVIDITWTNNRDLEGANYFGIKIPTPFINKNLVDTLMAEPLIWKYIWGKTK